MGTTIRWVVLALCGGFASGQVCAATSSSGAYGAELTLNANVQVIGLGVGAAALARTPNVQFAGSSSYGPLSQSVLGVQVGLLGTRVLDAGVLRGETEYQSATPITRSKGGAEGVTVDLQITPLLPLLRLTADSIEARARITGVCGRLQASGEAELVNARVTSLGGSVLQLDAFPAPNSTVSLSALGIAGVALVLNEQRITQTGNSMAIEVNAVHLDVSANALLASLVGDIVIGHARAERTCAPGDGPNLRGSKVAAPQPGVVGQPLVFTLSAVNNGNQNAPAVVLSDALHPSFQFQAVQAGSGGQCQHVAPTVTCTWPTVAVGETVTAQVTVIPTQAGTWPNTLNVGFDGPDGDPGDDSPTIDVVVQPAPIIANAGISLQATPNPALTGQSVTLVVTGFNSGPDGTPLSITHTLGGNVTISSITPSGSGSCTGTTTLSCGWALLPAGSSETITIVLVGNAPGIVISQGVLSLPPGVTDPDPSDNSAELQIPIQTPTTTADLAVVKTAAPVPGRVGQPLVFTLSVSNSGPDASGARVTDLLDGGLQLQSAVASDGGSCAGAPEVVCTWSSIPAGATRTATLTTVPTQAGVVRNTAVVASTTGALDPDPLDDSSTIEVPVNPAQGTADLALELIASPNPVTVTEPLVLALSLRNAGPDSADVQISHALPANVTLQSAIAAQGGSCAQGAAVVCTWSVVPSGAVRSATLTVRPAQVGSLVATAVASSTDGSVDPNPADNSASSTVQVVAAEVPPVIANVATTVRAVPAAVTLGQTLELQIEARNAGPDATSLRIDQVLDGGFALLDNGGANCTAAPTLQCTYANVASGAVVQLNLRVRANRTGTLSHVATTQVLAPATDPDLADNTGRAEAQVSPPAGPAIADLGVHKEAFPLDPVIGAPVDYVLTLSNAGPEAAAGPIVLIDEMPAQMRILSATAQGETPCTVVGQTVRCTVDGLAAGASLSASVLAVADVVGAVNNRVRITHPNTDPNPANDEADIWVQVRARDGIAADGTQCRITDRLTAHGDPSFVSVAGMQYGGSSVILADRESASPSTFVRSLLRDARKQRLNGLPALADARLLDAAQSSDWAVVASNSDLNGDAGGGGLYLVDVSRGDRHRLTLSASATPLLKLDGGGDFVYALTAASGSGSELVEIKVADRSRRSLASFPVAVTQFRALEVSSTGAQVAVLGPINPIGGNADGGVELFRLDVATGQWQQLTNNPLTEVELGGFDGAGRQVVWQELGHLYAHATDTGVRQLTTTAAERITPRWTHNGTQLLYLSAQGTLAGSLELVQLDVSLGTSTVLTRIDRPANGRDRLLGHDGTGRTLLLASSRALLGEAGLVGEHVYRVDCDHIRAGAWYNPARSGQGYAISRSQDGLVVLWYTYRADGSPTWYIASGPAQGKSWQADLLDVRFNAADGSRTLTTVGTLALSFADSHRAIAHWTLEGITRFEAIQFLGFDADPPARDDTGIWYEPAVPGWGMSVSHQDQTRFVLAYVYDTAGRPIWVEGQQAVDGAPMAARSYFGPGLCATTCGDSAPPPSARSTGEFTLRFPALAELWVDADYRLGGDPGLVWQRSPCRFAPLVPLNP